MTNIEKALLILALENTIQKQFDESPLPDEDIAFVSSVVDRYYNGVETEEDALNVIEDMTDLTLSILAELKAE
ncbi:hypothetical protein [Mesobacillus zeae]|uniref:Uncharacterized protein n=1 Tax=Mesobacillus zeae TaxID=1917180 RepID=A0A398BNR2_9BACI|nr:hypothetical protein [Mesobacillus zeae]RID88986.1 hypothetical protein D1970_00350 [Mesobacillus zeae]